MKYFLILILVIMALFVGHILWQGHGADFVGAAESGNLEQVRQLLKNGAPINQIDGHRFGWTPLIAAIYGNQTNVIHYLVEAGADVNLPSADGSTPMMWGAAYGDKGVYVIKYLIDHGAKLDAKDKNGNTVFDRAKSLPPKPKLLEVLEAAKREKEPQFQKK